MSRNDHGGLTCGYRHAVQAKLSVNVRGRPPRGLPVVTHLVTPLLLPLHLVSRHTDDVSHFVDDIRRARLAGHLPERFRPDDVRRACSGWADHTYGSFCLSIAWATQVDTRLTSGGTRTAVTALL